MDYKNVKYRGKETIPEYLDKPANIFEQVFYIMRNESVLPYPFINHVNNVSHDVLQVGNVFFIIFKLKFDFRRFTFGQNQTKK